MQTSDLFELHLIGFLLHSGVRTAGGAMHVAMMTSSARERSRPLQHSIPLMKDAACGNGLLLLNELLSPPSRSS
jgi:hypothetical protein